MMHRARRAIAVAACLGLLCTLHALAGGLYGLMPYYTLDLTDTFDQISIAGEDAFTAMELLFLDLGVPPNELVTVRTEFDNAMAGIESFTGGFPMWIPVPLLGAGLEIDLPLLLIDGVRLTGGLLSDGLVRSVVQWAGVEIPDPLLDLDFEIDTYSGSAAADLTFSTWMLSTEVVKRFDLLVLALNLGAGVDLIGGRIGVVSDFDLPAEFQEGVDNALAALHLDALHWSSFAFHGTLGFEIGPPFLRLYGEIRWLLPVGQEEEWWRIRVAPIAGMIGFVIRF